MKKNLLLLGLIISLAGNAQKIIPSIDDGVYAIKLNNAVIRIDPRVGGRISALEIDGKNFLTGKDVNQNYWGSSLWPSPQKAWGGKLSPELDELPYSAAIEADVIKLKSARDAKFGFVFEKQIYGDVKSNSFNIRYIITNRSDSTRMVAPWEVTRVHTNGMAFFPKGTGERWGNLSSFAEDKDGITWFYYDQDKIPAQHHKFFSDGAGGWVAQINNDVIFLKKFSDIPATKAAPGEAEIEIYTDQKKSYVEIEQQGSYQKLQPGESLTWDVKWFISKLPGGIDVTPGSKALVSYVEKILQEIQ